MRGHDICARFFDFFFFFDSTMDHSAWFCRCGREAADSKINRRADSKTARFERKRDTVTAAFLCDIFFSSRRYRMGNESHVLMREERICSSSIIVNFSCKGLELDFRANRVLIFGSEL